MPSKRIKNLDRVCLVILVAVAIGGLLWNAAVMIDYQRKLQEVKELEDKELTGLAQAAMKKKALHQAVEQLRSEKVAMKKRIPQQTDMGALLKQLTARMKERRITMVTIQPQVAVPEEFHLKTPLRLVFQGGFVQIYRFFTDMETMDRLLVPEKVTITGLEQDHLCQVDSTVLVFERKAVGAGR